MSRLTAWTFPASSLPGCWRGCTSKGSRWSVLNRFDEIPSFVQFAGVLADCTLSETGEKQALLQQALIAQLAHSEKLAGMSLPEPDAPAARHALDAGARASSCGMAWCHTTTGRSSSA
jgi:hypothetical protein